MGPRAATLALIASASACAASKIDAFPLDSEFNYVVHVDLPSDLSKDPHAHTHSHTHTYTHNEAPSEIMTMRDANGVAYECSLPSSLTSSQLAERRADERLSISASIVSSLTPACVSKRIDYWSYEVCHGKAVTQFHSEPPPVAPGDSGPRDATPVRGAELSLGMHDASRDYVHPHTFGSLALSQRFNGGTDGREAVVTYTCETEDMAPGVVQDILSVTEGPPRQYSIVVGVRDRELCAQLPSVRRLVAPLNSTCIIHTEGWWTYKICLGTRIDQYHEENGKAVAETVLGVYDWRAGESLDLASLGENPAVVQTFMGGTPCPVLHGERRSAVVRFECLGNGGADASAMNTMTLVGVSEPSTCKYKIVIGAPSLCEHPSLVSAKSSSSAARPLRTISCVPRSSGRQTAAQ